MPKISVLMPVYNGEKYVKEAIESILNQTCTDFEFIIINDCSTDSTKEIIKSYDDSRIVYVENEVNSGISDTLNKGILLAKGEYLARMDADDISLPKRFETQLEFMDANPDVAVCGSNLILFEKDKDISNTEHPLDFESILCNMIFSCSLSHPSVFIRKEILIKNNLKYEKEFDRQEDYHLWVRLVRYGRIVNIPEFLLRYRVHSNQITQNRHEGFSEGHKKIKDVYLKDFLDGFEQSQYEQYCRFCTEDFEATKDNIIKLGKFFDNLIMQNKKIRFFEQDKMEHLFGIIFRKALLNSSLNKNEIKECRRKALLTHNIKFRLLFLKVSFKYRYNFRMKGLK